MLTAQPVRGEDRCAVAADVSTELVKLAKVLEETAAQESREEVRHDLYLEASVMRRIALTIRMVNVHR